MTKAWKISFISKTQTFVLNCDWMWCLCLCAVTSARLRNFRSVAHLYPTSVLRTTSSNLRLCLSKLLFTCVKTFRRSAFSSHVSERVLMYVIKLE